MGRDNKKLESEAEAPRAPGRAGRVAAVLLVLAAAAGAGWLARRALSTTHLFDLRAVTFEGAARATVEELRALSPVRPGDSLLRVDPDAVEAALLRHPWVKRVEVRRAWPPALRLRVVERRPAALVQLGALYLLDEDAEPFKRAAPGDGLDLPVVTGLTRADWIDRRAEAQALLAGAVALARSWREGGWEEKAPLSEIHLDPGDGTTIYVGAEGTEVRLGSGDLPAKLARLRQVLTALEAEGQKAEVLHLDNRLHPSRVAVRLARGGGG